MKSQSVVTNESRVARRFPRRLGSTYFMELENNPLRDINNARNLPRNPDIIRDFSRLQADVNTLSVSNLAFAQRIMRMHAALRKANNMLAGLGIGDKSPLRLEIADILSNVQDDRSPLAFGADPAAAGCVTKVPKAW